MPIPPPADEALVTWLRSFALEHPRWGYKRAHSEANKQGWSVDRKRIQRLWRNAGLKVPYRKRKKPTHGKGVAMGVHQPTQTNVCWAMDFCFDQTTDTRPIKVLNVIDEYSRECLASIAGRSMDAKGVVAVLDDLLAERGNPSFIRLDNGPEFIAGVLADWCKEVGVTLYFIEPGSPWLNGKVESFNSRLRDELLNGELFESVAEAQKLLDRWRAEYNAYRPHSSLGYLPPNKFVSLDLPQQRSILCKYARACSWWKEVEGLAS